MLSASLCLVAASLTAHAQVRVACVGDSITAGVGATSGNSYPSQLGRLLGSGYTVGNFGHSGATLMSTGDLPYINQPEYTNSGTFNPNIVVIMLGTNDAKDANWANHASFNSDYNALVAHYRNLSTHPVVYVMTPPFVYNNGFGGNMATTLNNQVVPMETHLANDNLAPLIDTHSATAGHASWFPDNVHPNDAGAGEIAAVVDQAILRGTVSVPSQWTNVDIDAPAKAGASYSFDGHTFSVIGSGGDIWNAADQFQYCYQTISGDATIVARVLTVDNTNAWAKAGVMIRESTAAGSNFVDSVLTPSNGANVQWRNASAPNGGGAGVAASAPYWVRLDRIAGTVSGYVAPDNAGAPGAWTLLSSQPIVTGNALIGLCVTAHNNGVGCLATFSNVTVTRTFQTESLTVLQQSAGDTHQIISWAGFTNGVGTNLLSNAVGDFVTYLVPNIPAGSYHMFVGVKKFNSRGICQMAGARADTLAFSNIGATEDQYAATEIFQEYDQGIWSPATTSDKALKFTLTGKNASSSSFTLAFDYIEMVLQ